MEWDVGDVVGWIDGWMDGGVIQGAEAVNLNSRLSLHLICMPKPSSYVCVWARMQTAPKAARAI